MEISNLSAMVKGWFIGNFAPTSLSTEACEVAVKRYKAGDKEPRHHHKIATEVTLILSGSALVNGIVLKDGEIIKVPPGSSSDFSAISDVVTVVVKVPSAKDDKFIE